MKLPKFLKLPVMGDPTKISREILKRSQSPETRLAILIYVMSSAYLVFHVVFLDNVNPATILAWVLWSIL